MAEIEDVVLLGSNEATTVPEKDMTDLQSLVTRSVEDAISHFEENIEPDMAKATDYYFGRTTDDLPSVSGRSNVISTDLRDATLDQIPELLEIFMGSDSVVAYKPDRPDVVEQAEQATDFANYVFYEDNPGFLILNAVLKDAGVRRLGYVKWMWEEGARVHGSSMSGLSENELMYLEELGVEYEIVAQYVGVVEQQDPESGATGLGQGILHDIEVQYRDYGCVRVEAVPPEEIVWTPEARSFDRAPMVAHVRDVPREELIALGINEDFIEEHMGPVSSTSTESLKWARQFYGSSAGAMDRDAATYDESQQPIRFAEVYMLVDTDDDGIAELRMFQCVGPQYTIFNGDGELVDEVPIAVFTPDPEPHTIPGLCNFDYLREVQRVKSQIQRGQLNSLAQSIENQMIVSQAQVNIRDLISPEISGLIRVRSDVNAVREIKHTFIGGDTLPVLQYYDQIKADRTGRAGPREGMDPNIMQSTTAEAVASTLSKSQQRIRMLARVYAETGFKKLFRGIYRLLVKHQKRERYVKLRGKYVSVNPAYWESDMDVTINVGLGTGSVTSRLQNLFTLATEQKEHLMAGSPIVSFAELRATYGKIADLMGYKDTDAFWRPWGAQEQAQFEQQQAEAAKNAEKDPAQRVVDVEELKIQADIAMKQREQELKELEIRLKDERERDKAAREFALREYEIELQYQAKIVDNELKQKVASIKSDN